jgi:hypothetical protein
MTEDSVIRLKRLVNETFYAAANGELPPGFDMWGLAMNDGWTVAHVAANQGTLPKEFDKWFLLDNDGCSVAHHAALRGHLPEDVPDDVLKFTDAYGDSVASDLLAVEETVPASLITRAKFVLGMAPDADASTP